MTLWSMLTVLSGASALAGGVAAAKMAGGGILRVTIGAVVGLFLGLLSMWVSETAGRAAYRSVLEHGTQPSEPAERALRSMYLARSIWIGVVLYGSVKIVELAISLAI
jgi:hypothetical protein